MLWKKKKPSQKNIAPLTITARVWNEICGTIGMNHAETGGILGSSDGGHTIDNYYFDCTARTTGGTYTPDIDAVNKKIAEWNKDGIHYVGPIHSHPRGFINPSAEDCRYGVRIMKAIGISSLFMPIVNVNNPPDGQVQFYPYSLDSSCRLNNQHVVIEPNYIEAEHPARSAQQFDRIKSLYPLDVLKRKTVVCIGLGGSRQFVEELARCGIGNIVLIDGDTVSTTNIATQQTYLSEIGRYKVDVVRERILDINPEVNVEAIRHFLDGSTSDEDFANIVGQALIQKPTDVLICGCTDNFFAQARSASLAMKYGTLYLAAQLYREGMAAEIYFSYPGITHSCPRCAMSSRYEAYANGYKNKTTSDGTPIFSTTRVNSIKGQIALMLLLYREDRSCVYSDMLDAVTDRNFIQIRMSPLADKALGIDIFQEAMNANSGLVYFDETVWIPQRPNTKPPCPLFGGTGNLLSIKDRIHDTRTKW